MPSGSFILTVCQILTDWARVVRSVAEAIGEGIHPKMITKGSSGSYFARARKDGKVQTVA